MKLFKKATFLLVFFIAGSVFSQQKVMTDLVGEQAGPGERKIEQKGYYHISSHNRRSESVSYWWSNRIKECVEVHVYDGYISKIYKKHPADCNKPSNSNSYSNYNSRSHKSYQYGDKDYGSTRATANAFERGYNDGVYNKTYHNIWKLKDTPDHYHAYNKGYDKGVKERRNRTSYHSGKSGYANHEYVQDLVGKDASSAYSTIKIREFSQVKEHKSNGNTYRIWYNDNTQQCVKTTSRNYKIVSVVKSNVCEKESGFSY